MQTGHFVAYLRSQDRAETTISAYLADLRQFSRWYRVTNGEDFSTERLTETDGREYRQFLILKGRAPATINRHLATLRNLADWLGTPFRVAGVDEVRHAPKWLEKRDQAAILRLLEKEINAANTPAQRNRAIRNRSIVVFLLNTGLRVSELCELAPSDVTITDRKGSVIVRDGKGRKSRAIPLNKSARTAVSDALTVRGMSDAPYLWKIAPRAVQRLLEGLQQVSGTPVTPHTLRHTFAKSLVDQGVPLDQVAALLGHDDLNTTKGYTRPSLNDLERVVALLD